MSNAWLFWALLLAFGWGVALQVSNRNLKVESDQWFGKWLRMAFRYEAIRKELDLAKLALGCGTVPGDSGAPGVTAEKSPGEGPAGASEPVHDENRGIE